MLSESENATINGNAADKSHNISSEIYLLDINIQANINAESVHRPAFRQGT